MKQYLFSVDGREMKVIDNYEGKTTIGADAPHTASTVRGHLHDAQCAMTALKDQCALARADAAHISVFEAFGGSGWQTAILRGYDPVPDPHIVWDYSQDCVDSIALSFANEQVRTMCTNSYTTMFPEMDWILLDFNNLTFVRYRDKPLTNNLIQRAARSARRWLSISDSAAYGLRRFARNRQAYAQRWLPAIADDWLAYYNLWDLEMRPAGWHLQLVRYWSGAAQMLFGREPPMDGVSVAEVEAKVPIRRLA